MTEAEALDEAAKAAGWRDWKTLQLIARPDKQDDIRRHARTLMENAALKAEIEALRALQEGDSELLTIAWMDGAHRSNKAHREKVAALEAKLEAKLVDVSNALMATAEAAASSAKKAVEAEAKLAVAREALEWIADRPGEGVEYLPGHGDEVISEARNMELIARAALKEIEGD